MRKYITIKGFTLLEVLVSIGIISVLSAVVLINQSNATNKVAISNAVNQFSVFARQAQVFGVGVRVADDGGGGTFDISYGVAGEIGNDYLILFADKNGNGVYDGTSACVVGSAQECLEKITFQVGVIIDDICGQIGASTHCKSTSATDGFSVVYTRPSPEGTLNFLNSSNNIISGFGNELMEVQLVNRQGDCRPVNIFGSGQITTSGTCS